MIDCLIVVLLNLQKKVNKTVNKNHNDSAHLDTVSGSDILKRLHKMVLKVAIRWIYLLHPSGCKPMAIVWNSHWKGSNQISDVFLSTQPPLPVLPHVQQHNRAAKKKCHASSFLLHPHLLLSAGDCTHLVVIGWSTRAFSSSFFESLKVLYLSYAIISSISDPNLTKAQNLD